MVIIFLVWLKSLTDVKSKLSFATQVQMWGQATLLWEGE